MFTHLHLIIYLIQINPSRRLVVPGLAGAFHNQNRPLRIGIVYYSYYQGRSMTSLSSCFVLDKLLSKMPRLLLVLYIWFDVILFFSNACAEYNLTEVETTACMHGGYSRMNACMVCKHIACEGGQSRRTGGWGMNARQKNSHELPNAPHSPSFSSMLISSWPRLCT